MMNLAEHELRFLATRQQLARAWPWVGAAMLGTIIVCAAWLYLRVPLLVNPFAVAAQLRDGSLSAATVTLMAGLLPLAVLACLILALALLAFGYAAFANEKRYLAIVQRVAESGDASERTP